MKKKKIIVFGIVLIAVIIMICLFFYSYNSDAHDSINGKTQSDQLLLSGIGVFSEKYNGFLETKEIMKKLEDITKQDLPDLYKDIKKCNEAELEKYYEEHKSSIKNEFGKVNVDEFKEFAKSLQKIEINLNDWYSLNIDRNSFVDESEMNSYAYVEYEVKFEKDKIQKFAIYISNKVSVNPSYIIDVK